MANITLYLTPDNLRPRRHAAPTFIRKRFALAAGNSTDVIQLGNIPAGAVVVGLAMDVSGTLGAGCVLTPRRGTTALAAASTAAAASRVSQSVTDVSTTDEMLNILIGAANVAATATVTVDVLFDAPVG
jgi:hypothetical protein